MAIYIFFLSRYIQKSFEANISLLHFITVATLVWMWTKRSSTHSGGITGVLSLVLAIACYKVCGQWEILCLKPSGLKLINVVGSHPGCSIKCDAAGKLGNTSPGFLSLNILNFKLKKLSSATRTQEVDSTKNSP